LQELISFASNPALAAIAIMACESGQMAQRVGGGKEQGQQQRG
jgi:hypothetical protein